MTIPMTDGEHAAHAAGVAAAYTEIANWKQPDHPVQCPCPTCPTIRSVARNIAHAAAVGIHQQAGYNVLDATDRADALIEDDEMVRLLHDAPGMAIVQIVQTGLAMLQHEPPPQT